MEVLPLITVPPRLSPVRVLINLLQRRLISNMLSRLIMLGHMIEAKHDGGRKRSGPSA